MDDKELLELAAKAAGMNWRDWTPMMFARETELRPWPYEWNPLTDDGDALRLTVKLQLIVSNEHVASGSVTVYTADETISVEERSGDHQPDVILEDYVATRRAITRAAAALCGPEGEHNG